MATVVFVLGCSLLHLSGVWVEGRVISIVYVHTWEGSIIYYRTGVTSLQATAVGGS